MIVASGDLKTGNSLQYNKIEDFHSRIFIPVISDVDRHSPETIPRHEFDPIEGSDTTPSGFNLPE